MGPLELWKIAAIMKQRRRKQVEVDDLFGIHQPDVFNLLRGGSWQPSTECLLPPETRPHKTK